MLLAEHLVQGADVWVNTPRRPWEASGTSGMKVLVNGGINLSELDGWWAEAYSPEVGWALGDEKEHGDDPAWDAAEADALYTLLEQQIVPEFYSCNEKKLSVRWVERMRKSMAILTPRFSANRAVREYTEQYYLPAATEYLKRAANKGAAGLKICALKNELLGKWNGISIGAIQTKKTDTEYQFSVPVFLNQIKPENVLIELYADGLNGAQPQRIKLIAGELQERDSTYLCQAAITTERPETDYTVRIIANNEIISVPLEENYIKWQR